MDFNFDQTVCLIGNGEVSRQQFNNVVDIFGSGVASGVGGSMALGSNADAGDGDGDDVANGMKLIAVDGGANHLKQWGLMPDVLIGDMDSVLDLNFFRETGVDILSVAEQNSTDLEKALINIEAPFYLAMGFIGSRFDHSLEILHLCLKYSERKILFVSGGDMVFYLPLNWELDLPVGARVSLYPLRRVVINKSDGLKYSLDGLEMEQGRLIGTSNEANGGRVLISQREQGLLCIVSSKFIKEIFTSLIK